MRATANGPAGLGEIRRFSSLPPLASTLVFVRVLVLFIDWPSGSRFCGVAVAGIRLFYLQDLKGTLARYLLVPLLPHLTRDQGVL